MLTSFTFTSPEDTNRRSDSNTIIVERNTKEGHSITKYRRNYYVMLECSRVNRVNSDDILADLNYVYAKVQEIPSFLRSSLEIDTSGLEEGNERSLPYHSFFRH